MGGRCHSFLLLVVIGMISSLEKLQYLTWRENSTLCSSRERIRNPLEKDFSVQKSYLLELGVPVFCGVDFSSDYLGSKQHHWRERAESPTISQDSPSPTVPPISDTDCPPLVARSWVNVRWKNSDLKLISVPAGEPINILLPSTYSIGLITVLGLPILFVHRL